MELILYAFAVKVEACVKMQLYKIRNLNRSLSIYHVTYRLRASEQNLVCKYNMFSYMPRNSTHKNINTKNNSKQITTKSHNILLLRYRNKDLE